MATARVRAAGVWEQQQCGDSSSVRAAGVWEQQECGNSIRMSAAAVLAQQQGRGHSSRVRTSPGRMGTAAVWAQQGSITYRHDVVDTGMVRLALPVRAPPGLAGIHNLHHGVPVVEKLMDSPEDSIYALLQFG